MNKVFIIGLAVLFYQCGNGTKENTISFASIPVAEKTTVQFNDPEKLVRYVNSEENGFFKSKSIDNITYSSMLKPVEYLLAQKRLKENNNKLMATDFEDLQYFDLRISVEDFKAEFIKYDVDSPVDYEERVKYCAFEMQNDIKLIDGNDTLECVMFHFERAYDVVPYGHFILGFETKKKSMIETKTLCFDDKLFNKGMIKFAYSPQTIAKQPVLL